MSDGLTDRMDDVETDAMTDGTDNVWIEQVIYCVFLPIITVEFQQVFS